MFLQIKCGFLEHTTVNTQKIVLIISRFKANKNVVALQQQNTFKERNKPTLSLDVCAKSRIKITINYMGYCKKNYRKKENIT